MAIYDKSDLKFMYPENWAMSEQSADPFDNSPREISLEAPSGCIWVLHVFDKDADAFEILDEMVQGLDQQYEDFEYTARPDSEILGNRTIGGEADFYCLDFLVTARIQVITTEDHVFCVLSQAESRDFEKMSDVFLAITTSLVQHDLPSSV